MESDSIEIRGRTVDEAIHAALDQLGVTRDDVEIEVLSEGRSGVFGVGSQDARVRVTIIGEDYEEEEEEEYERQPGVVGEQAEEEEGEGEEAEEEEAAQPVAVSEEQTEAARETLERMLDLLEFPNLVTVRAVQRDRAMTNILLDVAGDD